MPCCLAITMLLYHPVDDSNHCCYRLIRLLYSAVELSMPLTSLLICDFYTLFPGQLKRIEGWPRKRSAAYTLLREIPDEYEEMLNPKRVFFQLNNIQSAAISHLEAKGIIQNDILNDSLVTLNVLSLPADLIEKLELDPIFSEEWFSLISHGLSRLPIAGKNGLKSKTGLMEFVYD
jgi:hypothetical protein